MVVGSPLHSVVDFSGCQLLGRLVGFLVHSSFGLKEYGTIFCVMVGFTVVEHAVWRSECVWASVVTATMIRCTASLIVLCKSLIGCSWVSFLWRWPKILLPILWWLSAILIYAIYWLRIAVLTVIVVRGPWGFI
jgi:hypothetical protein